MCAGSNVFYVLFLSGILLPAGIIPQFFVMQQLGIYDTRFGYILLWLSRVALPIFIITGFIKSIPSELDDAAAIDGCSYIRYIFQVVVPLIQPALSVVGLIIAIRVWNDIIGPVIFLPSQLDQADLGRAAPVLRRVRRAMDVDRRGDRHHRLAAGPAVHVHPALHHRRDDQRGAQRLGAYQRLSRIEWREERGSMLSPRGDGGGRTTDSPVPGASRPPDQGGSTSRRSTRCAASSGEHSSAED